MIPVRSILVAVTLLLSAPVVDAKNLAPPLQQIADRIATKKEWVATAKACPAALMAKPGAQVPVGEDSCKVAVTACFSRCEKGDGPACYWLAYQLQTAGAAPAAYETLFQRSCKLGIVSGCTNHAAALSDDPAWQSCAVKTFEQGCTYDDPWACTMLALHLSRGIGVAVDRQRALKVLEKSCKYGDDDSACQYAKQMRRQIEQAQRKIKGSGR